MANISVAQQPVDRSPKWSYHDDNTYIRAHDNHKYFQEYTNHNGGAYMYYNKTYNNKSKNLYFYKIQFDAAGKITKKTELDSKGDDFSDSLYFEKDVNMNSAFFGVDDYLFVVVQNEKKGKNQLYRYCISLDTLHIVDLDNGSFYDRYFAAVASGYDVILFTRGYAESYTFSKTDNNLHYNERIRYQVDSEDAAVVSAVAMTPPYQDDPLAYAALKDPDKGNFQICTYDFKDLSQTLIQYDVFDGKAMRLVGGRSYLPGNNQVANTDGSAYISMFSTKDEEYKNDKTKPYYKRCPIMYGEIKLTSVSFLAVASQAYLVLPSDDYYADDGDDALIDIVENYVSMDKSSELTGNDGFQKQNILVNCDKNNETNYSVFPSDYYLINPNDSVQTDDMLSYTEDPQWKQMWSLIGIFDGAPPCALNWHAWDSIHQQAGKEIAPTELVWGMEGEKSTATSVETENTWSLGCKGSITAGKKLQLSIGAGGKYAKTNQKINELSKSILVDFSIPISLTEENQQNALWYWLVPTISRYPYCTFDYSDSVTFQHPILDRTDYAYITREYDLKPEAVPFDSAPHFISNPNGKTMEAWTKRENYTDPTSIAFHAFQHGLSSTAHVSYTSEYGGTESKLVSEKEQTTEQTTSSTKAFNINAGIKIPKIFTFKVAFAEDWTYSTSNTVTTTFTTGVEFNMANMTSATSSAIYPQSYFVNPYFFTPDEYADWWYFDNPSLMGFKPWYIAYTVTLDGDASSKLLSLVKPEPQELFYSDEPIDFSWTHQLHSTKLVISNAPTASLKAIVYSTETGKESASVVTGLGTGTYYWRVGGLSAEGMPVWSEFRKFTLVHRDFLAEQPVYQPVKSHEVLPAKVYPNPSFAQPVSVLYEVKDETSPVTLILYSLSGVKQWESVHQSQKAGLHHHVIPAENLNIRMGILKIINGNYIATRKLVVH